MRTILLTSITALALTAGLAPASAASCYDLWYERNQIFDDNGYCFKSDLGKETFDNSDCYTSHPDLTRAEQRRVAAIKARERAKGCKVNN
jgi:YARHG domain